jgi:hypothetical protein
MTNATLPDTTKTAPPIASVMPPTSVSIIPTEYPTEVPTATVTPDKLISVEISTDSGSIKVRISEDALCLIGYNMSIFSEQPIQGNIRHDNFFRFPVYNDDMKPDILALRLSSISTVRFDYSYIGHLKGHTENCGLFDL